MSGVFFSSLCYVVSWSHTSSVSRKANYLDNQENRMTAIAHHSEQTWNRTVWGVSEERGISGWYVNVHSWLMQTDLRDRFRNDHDVSAEMWQSDWQHQFFLSNKNKSNQKKSQIKAIYSHPAGKSCHFDSLSLHSNFRFYTMGDKLPLHIKLHDAEL